MTGKPYYILCVDDDIDDTSLLCELIAEANPSLEIVKASNGEEALSHLVKAKISNELPCLILLDINMPRMDGKQTLTELKKDDILGNIPVVVFSTSNAQMDKLFCAYYGVQLYTKPNSTAEYRTVIHKLLSYCTTERA